MVHAVSTSTVISTFVVLYTPWIPGEHRRGICAVECVTAHLRGFEEDSRSKVVFWIEWSTESGFYWLDVAHVHDHSPLSALQKLSNVSCVILSIGGQVDVLLD